MGKSQRPPSAVNLATGGSAKGLLDFCAAPDTSHTAQLTALSADDTFGLPPFLLTASRETLLAYIAIFLGGVLPTPSSAAKPKKRGRPFADLDIDRKRAWVIWWYVRQQRELGASHVGSMTFVQLIEDVRGLPGGEKLLPRSTTTERLVSSISDGKRKLNIDDDWHSGTCEKFLPLIAIEDKS
jgi:hypothetical protein